jgi:hypothetical protein
VYNHSPKLLRRRTESRVSSPDTSYALSNDQRSRLDKIAAKAKKIRAGQFTKNDARRNTTRDPNAGQFVKAQPQDTDTSAD